MPHERYHEAVDYLQRRLWHELPIVPIERALQGRIRHLLAHFGDPHIATPVIHVGGSAGKGSTSTIAAAILRAAGLRTGLYTSPHLQTFIERIRVGDRLIAPEDFAEIVLGLEPLVRKMHLEVIDGVGFGRPSLVEVAFAAGMKHFADQRVEAAVVEVGLGGRTDCTNVFDATQHVAVLTNVDYEHRERLGWTLPAIAREKVHIIHGGTVVTGAQRREVLPVIEERCDDVGARLWRLGRDVKLRITKADATGSIFDLETPLRSFETLRLPLAGPHQASNAALAVAATLAHGEMHGVPIDEQHVRRGLADVRISGRLEAVQQDPLVLLDSAHNPLEAKRLAEALRAHWLRDGRRKLTLVIGILADKDQPAMVRALSGIASAVIVTQPPLGERAGDPERMLRLFAADVGEKHVTFEPSPGAALDLALSTATRESVVCVTGSMFLVGALRERWLPESQILERRSAEL
jgi:dihydrofolate synthase/folylpolyglutamate synthase